MKKTIISTLLVLMSANAMATQDNYVFAQAGVGVTTSGIFDEWFNSYFLPTKKGLSGRVGIGHDFNDYFALESGVAFYPSITRVDDPKVTIFHNDVPAATSEISDLASVDLMAKASLPIKSAKLFVMGGASVTHAKYSATVNSSAVTFNWKEGSKNFVTPKVGVGLSVPVKANINFELTAMTSPSKGYLGERDYLPQLNTATVGLQWRG